MAAQGVIIRPLHADDRAGWEPLWQGYLTFYKTTLPTNVTDMTWQRLLDAAEPMNGLVAERDGDLIGLAHYLFHRSTWSQTYYCYLEDLFVATESRAGGSGQRWVPSQCGGVGNASRAVAGSAWVWTASGSAGAVVASRSWTRSTDAVDGLVGSGDACRPS